MKKNVWFEKPLILFAIFIAVAGLSIFEAGDACGEDLQSEIRLRDDAPLYQGPVQEGDLEALAPDDFEAFGNEAFLPEEQFRKYQEVLADPPSGILVPYRMKVIDRELTPNDFFGFNVSEELSNARYESYVSMNPETIGGRTIHYAYVYHYPVANEASLEPGNDRMTLREMP